MKAEERLPGGKKETYRDGRGASKDNGVNAIKIYQIHVKKSMWWNPIIMYN